MLSRGRIGGRLGKTEVGLVGNVSWGTHLCQFYETREDLLDILIPYWEAGLKRGQFCIWATSEFLGVAAAKAALAKAVKNLDEYVNQGQIEIVDAREFYTRSGKFEPDEMLQGWFKKERQAVEGGFTGVRAAGEVSWLEERDWRALACHETTLDNIIGKHRMIAICLYSLDKCSVDQIIDASSSHQGALIRRQGKWDVIENLGHKRATEEALRQSWQGVSNENAGRKRRRQTVRDTKHLPESMLRGLRDAVFILDSDAVEILDCNSAASDIFGYSRGEMLGRTTTFLHVDEAALEEFRRHLHPATEEKGFLRQFKFRMKRKDGSVFPTEHDVTPLADEQGNRVAWLSVVRDITEREASRQRLEQVEDWARTLDSIADLVFLIDSDFRLLRVNKGVADAFSRKPEELVGKHCYEIVHGTDGPVPYCPHRKTVKTGEATSVEFFEPHLGIHPQASTSPIFNDKGEVMGSVHIVKDITQLKRVEQALRETEERWRAIYEQSPIGLGISAPDGKVVSANQAMQTITGYSSEELKHINLADTYENPEDRKRLLNILAQHGSVANYATRLKRKDGTPYDALLHVAHVYFNGDDVLQTTCIDITEHKKVEEALRKSEERYRSLVEGSHAGIAASDLEGKFTFVNNAVSQMIGYSKDEMIGSRFIDFIHPDDRSRILQVFQAAPISSRSVIDLEFRVVRKNGEVMHLFASATPLKDGHNIVGAISIIADITSRKQVEEKLRESERKLTTLFEILPVGVSILDVEGNIIYTNPALEMILDISRAGLFKGDCRSRAYLKSDGTLMPAEEYASARAIKERMAVHNVETGVVKEDGNVIWTSVSAVPVAFLDWKVVIVTSDITERKRAQDELIESEQRFRSLFELAPDAIMTLDMKGTVTSCNPATLALLGFSEDELVGKHFSRLPTGRAADIPRYVKMLSSLVRGRVPLPFEAVFYGKDGSQRFGEVRIGILKLSSGKLGIQVVTRDITGRKRAEEQLRQQRDQAQSYLDIAGVMIVAIDSKGKVTLINHRGSEILGYEAHEIIGKDWFDHFLPARLRAEVRDVSHSILAGEIERFRSYENPVLTKSGQERIIIWHTVTLADAAGNILGHLSSGEDITERKRAEEQLRQSWQKVRKMLEGTVGALASVAEKRDPYTAGHQERVSRLACAIAEQMGLPEAQIEGIRVAGTLHDIGKMYVPAEILNKPGALADVEMALVRVHSEAGYDIVKGIEFPWPVAQAILQHHERLDGSGYPAGLAGEDIILEARILGVADVVEAMSSPRPFRRALSMDETLEEISRNRGVLYDPRVVDACLKLFTEKGFRLEHKR